MAQQLIYPAGQVSATTPLTGAELVAVDAGGATDSFATTAQIAALAATETTVTKITALTTVGAGTITAAGIVGKITSRGGAQSATAFSDTTDSAANIIAALPSGAPNGSSFVWRYENTTDGAATILAGVGVTLAGAVVVPKGCWLEYLVVKTSGTVVTITSVTGGSMTPVPATKFSTIDSAAIGVSTLAVAGLTGAQEVTLSITGSVGPFTVTTPSAVEIFAAYPNAIVGGSYILNVQNLKTTTGVGTLSAGGGVTVTGTATIAQNAARRFNVALTSATAVTITSIGAMSL